MKKGKKGSSYIGFALICIILGSILISVGHFIKHDLSKGNNELLDVTAKVATHEDTTDGKVKVTCKYGVDGNEYSYVCFTGKKEDANANYKIGSERTIKVNKKEPGHVTILDVNYVIIAIYTIGLIFFFIAIIYMICEIVRLAKGHKVFNNDLEEGNI